MTTQQTGDTQGLPSAVKTAIETTGEAFDRAARCQQELLRFSSLRMNRYLDIPQDLRACRSPIDFFQYQMEFLVKSHMDYLNESSRIMEEVFAAKSANGRSLEKYGRTILKAQKDAEKIIELAKSQAARIIAEAEARSRSKPEGEMPVVEEQRHVA